MKKYFYKILLLFLLIIPINVFAYSKYVIPGGETIGIEVNSKGILVVDFYKVNNHFIAKEAGFEIGDRIIKVENIEVNSINEMLDIIKNINKKNINFLIERNNTNLELKLKLTKENDIIKTGLYVKDKINGIGTITYIDPETKIYGSLGHEIVESKTLSRFEIKDGNIYEASVQSIIKRKRGVAGEKNAITNKNNLYGTVKENELTGIYGTYTKEINKDLIEISDTITTGEAYIKTVIKDDVVEDFKINILQVDKKSKTKNILFEITDSKLLKETGGIIQGMSGSPIIQNNKLVGAVNYVIVNDTSKGYGIFITTMLKEGDS